MEGNIDSFRNQLVEFRKRKQEELEEKVSELEEEGTCIHVPEGVDASAYQNLFLNVWKLGDRYFNLEKTKGDEDEDVKTFIANASDISGIFKELASFIETCESFDYFKEALSGFLEDLVAKLQSGELKEDKPSKDKFVKLLKDFRKGDD